MGAETGVGRVVVEAPSVVADLGYTRSGVVELGVVRARFIGDVSMRALRDDCVGEPSNLSFEPAFFECKGGAIGSAVGMTRGDSWRAWDC